jgi:hypothetical protein
MVFGLISIPSDWTWVLVVITMPRIRHFDVDNDTLKLDTWVLVTILITIPQAGYSGVF